MAEPSQNQIIGVCRFSYLGLGGFNLTEQPTEAAAAALYDPERMLRRFAYFEDICLPSLAAQTDRNFTLIALIADSMPYRWRRRLKDLMAKYTFLELCTLEAAGPLNATRRAFRRGHDGTAPFVTGFRIDDDDAVAVDYIEKTRALADGFIAQGWVTDETPLGICFHQGLYWDMNRTENAFWRYREKQPLGLASAMVTRADATQNIYRWNHRRLAANVRCWTDPTEMMFVRTLHGHNDSDRSIPPDAEKMTDHAAKQVMRERFGLSPRKIVPAMHALQREAKP